MKIAHWNEQHCNDNNDSNTQAKTEKMVIPMLRSVGKANQNETYRCSVVYRGQH